jgi:hypothetical protein
MIMKKRKSLLGICLAALSFASVASDMKLQKTKNSYLIFNGMLKAKITAQGSMITMLQDLKNQQNHVASDGAISGLGKARIYENLRNQEPAKGMYKLTVVKNDAKTISIRATYTDKDRRYKTKGFEFIKTYTLHKGESRLIFDYMLKAHASTAEFSPFIHNLFKLPQEKSYAFSQTRKGLFCKEATPKGNANNFVTDLTEPWGALISPEVATGIIEINDPDKLNELFFWLGNEQYATIEPLFNKTRFAADAIWKSRMYYMPVSGLKSCHFAVPEYAGGFTTENGKDILKFFPAIQLGTVKISVSLNRQKLLDETFNTTSGKVVSLPVPLPAGISKLKVTVTAGKLRNTHNIFASAKLITGQVKGRQAVYNLSGKKDQTEYAKAFKDKQQTYISPDITSFIQFRLLNKLGKRKRLGLTVEAPVSIKLLNPMGHNNVSRECTKENITLNGKPYIRYNVEKNYRRLFFFTSTKLNPGSKGKIYYYAEWDGGKQPKQTLPFTVIAIEKAPIPKRLISNLGWMSAKVHLRWPEFHKSLKHIGINTVCSTSYDHHNPEIAKKTVALARQHGMYYASNYSPFGGFMRKDLAKDKNARAVSLYGKTSPMWICPSFRGDVYLNEIERATFFGQFGVQKLWLDCEFWGGADYCFCPRCIRGFKEFMTKKYSSVKYIAPQKFMKRSENYPKYIKIWKMFHAQLGNEMYGGLAKMFKQKIKKAGPLSGTYELGTYGALPSQVLYSHFLNLKQLINKNILTIAQPSAYSAGDALVVGEKVKNVRAFTKKSNIVSWLSSGYDVNSECKSDEFRYCILENYLNGAGGFTLFTWAGCDALDLKEIAETMRMLAPVENVIVDGKVMKNLKSTNKKVKICGLETPSEKLILVSEYYQSGSTSTSFTINVPQNCKAVNMRTGQIIAQLKKGANKVTAILPSDDRAQVIYIGNRKLRFSASAKKLAKTPSATVKKASPNPKLGISGDKLKIAESKRYLNIENAYYKVTFDKKYVYFAQILFKNGNTLAKGSLATNFLQIKGGKPLNLLKSGHKVTFQKSADGTSATLSVSANFKSKSYNVNSIFKATFYAGKPVIRIQADLKQNPAFKWMLVRLNQWQPFLRQGKKTSRIFPDWSIAEPFRTGSFNEVKRNLAATNWRKGYRWIAAFNDKDAFGIICFGKQRPFIYVYNKDNYYMNGRYGGWDTKELSIDQYIYIGPVGDKAKVVGKWAAQLARE